LVDESWPSSGSSWLSSSGMIWVARDLGPAPRPHWSNESIVPDRSLGEHDVLVQGDHRPQQPGREDLGQGWCWSGGCPPSPCAARPARGSPRPRTSLPRSGRTPAPAPGRTRSRSAGSWVVAQRVSGTCRTRSGRPGPASSPGGAAGRSCAGRWWHRLAPVDGAGVRSRPGGPRA